MKITYLKLVNYIGIYNGLGKTKIEIDFTKCKNRIVMLNGENGSGKSTLMSTLHPFANTIDDKSDIILPNKEGIKEIHYDIDGVQYKIIHRYNYKSKSKTTKSYISKMINGEWVDLNENGNVTSFKALVKDIFAMEESYFKLLYVGSDVTNFIDLSTAQRKKFISNFLPNIDPYLKAYKTVSDKWTFLKKNITTISDQIKKLDTRENLENLRVNTEGTIKLLTKQKTEIEKKMAVVENKIESLNELRVIDEYKEVTNTLNEAEVTLRNANNTLNTFYKKNEALKSLTLQDIETKISRGESKLNEYETQLKQIDEQIEKLNIEVIDLRNKRDEKDTQLRKNTTRYSLNEYEKLLSEYKEKILELREEQRQRPDCNLSNDELRFIELKIRTFLENRRSLLELFDTQTIEDYQEGKFGDARDCNNELIKLGEQLEDEKQVLGGIEEDIAFYNSKVSLKNILSQRPASCKNDNCSFISEALAYQDVEDTINKLLAHKEVMEESIQEIENKMNTLNDVIKLDMEISRKLYNPISQCADYLKKLNLYEGIFNHKSVVVKNLTKNYDDILNFSPYYEYIYYTEEIEKINEKLPSIKSNIELLENTNELIVGLQNDIKEYSAKMEEDYQTIDRLNTKKGEINRFKDSTTKSIALLNKLGTAIKDKDNNEALLKKIKDENKVLEEQVNQLKELNENFKVMDKSLHEFDIKLDPLGKELDKVKFNLAKLEEYEERKRELEDKFGKLSILRDSLSPTKGIPVLFTSMFLKPTKRIANELLSMSYKGDLAIQDFEITDSDFFIKLQKSDYEILKDVKLASQGETALTSIAISMALVEQAISKYNIILLDEIDATLDVSNRQGFLDMLESQLDKLGVEQTFIISHNNSFDTYPVDLVLFKGSSIDSQDSVFMKNKNIVFEI